MANGNNFTDATIAWQTSSFTAKLLDIDWSGAEKAAIEKGKRKDGDKSNG